MSAPAPAPLPPEWQALDAIGSWREAIRAIGERVRAGEPVPPCLRSSREDGER